MFNEKKLIAKAKHDKESFLALYNIYYPKIYAYVLARAKNRELAEDILQDTFIKALQALKNYEYTGKSFGAWLFRIATNKLKDHWRAGNKTVSYADGEELELKSGAVNSTEQIFVDEENLQLQNEQQRKLFAGLNKLSPEEKELITLKYFSKLAYKDVAAIYKITPGHVAVRLHRVLNKLKKTII
ncbi:MAG: RNA polymerase sigma factor [Parcubacteria group bacterium]